MKFLEIAGSRKKSNDWDNIRDIPVRGSIVHDMTQLPIPGINDNTYDGVFSEHFIEHLTKEQGISFLREMYRVMKTGAVIRTIWPAMDYIEYLKSDQDLSMDPFVDKYTRYIIDSEKVFTNQYYKDIDISTLRKQDKVALRLLHQEGEHKHLWYKNELIDQMIELGFREVREEQYYKSRLLEFNNIDNKQEMRILHSTVVEAIK